MKRQFSILSGTGLLSFITGIYCLPILWADPVVQPINPINDSVTAELPPVADLPSSQEITKVEKNNPNDNTPLLEKLQAEFEELAKTSEHQAILKKAEQLLVETNDNTHWTNYAAATKLLRQHPDKAAIPLLMRYIVIHAERSSAHVMIPEYARTLSILSGHPIKNPYSSGPHLPGRMHNEIQALYKNWWVKQSHNILNPNQKHSEQQLAIIIDAHLENVVRYSDYRSNYQLDTAYGIYHMITYRIHSNSSSNQVELPKLDPRMVRILLSRYGYQNQQTKRPAPEPEQVPFEVVPLLAGLAKTENQQQILTLAADKQQNGTVRLLCVLALYKAGQGLKTDLLLDLLKQQPGFNVRLAAIMSLRYGGKEALPYLLKTLEDKDLEVALTAACALQDSRPIQALPKLKNLMNQQTNRGQSMMLIFGVISEYENLSAKEIMAEYLQAALAGGPQVEYLDRATNAFERMLGPNWKTGPEPNSEREVARLLLAYHQSEKTRLEQKVKRLNVELDSLKKQFSVLTEILQLRRSEYKRLLLLQGDDIVSSEDSAAAQEKVNQVQAELDLLQRKLIQRTAELETTDELLE